MTTFSLTLRIWVRSLAVGICFYIALVNSALFAQEVKWRTPQLSELHTVQQELVVPNPVPPTADSFSSPSLLDPPATYYPAETLPPPVATGPAESWDPLGYYFQHADNTLPAIEEWERSCTPLITPFPLTKPGFFQKFGVSGSWIEGESEGRAPMMTDFSTFTTFAVPFPIREWPLNITPGFDARFLDGPLQPDLPGTLYDAYLDFTWNLRITQRATQVFSIAPGYYSDFESNSDNGFRVTGKSVGTYDIVKHRITLVHGTIYLGRDDLKWLFMGGLVFTPNEWSRFEVVFPTPRASVRLRCGPTFEDWLYLGADFYGGQTWSIERASGSPDHLTILDNRALLGYERRRPGGAGWNLEGGWVFNRDIRYRSNPART